MLELCWLIVFVHWRRVCRECGRYSSAAREARRVMREYAQERLNGHAYHQM